jgi:PAS domain S-box-containing protein
MAAEVEDLQAMWLDLTAHVDELAAERQQYLEIFEHSSEAYVVTDALGMIRDANGAAVDILQRRKRFLRGKPLAVLVALEHRPEFRRRLGALAQGNGAERSWRTMIESPRMRTAVTLTARPIERTDGIAGLCWLLQAEQ